MSKEGVFIMVTEIIFAVVAFGLLIVAGFADKNKKEGKELKGILANPAYIMYTRQKMA